MPAMDHAAALAAENALLRARIAQLEQLMRAQIAPDVAPSVAPSVAPPIAPPHAPPDAPPHASHPFAATHAASTATPSVYATNTPPRVPTDSSVASPLTAVSASSSTTAASLPDKAASTKPVIEVFVGRNIVPFVGAIAVLAAIGFFVDYAIEIGLLGRMPAEARFGMGIVAGFALLAAGEVVRRRMSDAAAVGLDAAGIGALMMTVALGVFSLGLFGPATGALAVMGAGILGVAWSVRTGSTVVAVVAVLGLFLSVVGFDLFREHSLLAGIHLTVALAAALALHAWGGARFAPVRLLGIVCILFLGGAFALRRGHAWNAGASIVHMTVPFVIAWWGLIAVEATFAAVLGRGRLSNAWILLCATIAALAVHALAWGAPFVSAYDFALLPLVIGGALVAQGLFLRGFSIAGDVESGEEADAEQVRAAANACGLLAMTAWALALVALLDGIASMVDDRAIAPLFCVGALAAGWIGVRVRFVAFDIVAVLASCAAFVAGVVALFSLPQTTASGFPPPLLFGIFPQQWHLSLELFTFAVIALLLMSAPKIGARVGTGIMQAIVGAIAWIVASGFATDGDFMLPCMAIPAFLVLWFPRATRTMVITALALTFAASCSLMFVGFDCFYGFHGFEQIGSFGFQLALISSASILVANHPLLGSARVPLTVIVVLVCGFDSAVYGAMFGRSFGFTQQDLALLFMIAQSLFGALIMGVARVFNKHEVATSGAIMTALSVLIGSVLGFGRLFADIDTVPDNAGLAYSAVLSASLAYVMARVTVGATSLKPETRRWIDAVGAIAIAPLGALAIAAALGGSIAGQYASMWMVAVATAEIALGFRRDWPALRWGGLATFFVLVARLYAIDLVGTPAPMRIALLFVSGVVLVTVGIVYARRHRAAT